MEFLMKSFSFVFIIIVLFTLLVFTIGVITYFVMFELGISKSKEQYYVANKNILPTVNIKNSEGNLIVAKKIWLKDKPKNAFVADSFTLSEDLIAKDFISKGTVLSFDMFEFRKPTSEKQKTTCRKSVR